MFYNFDTNDDIALNDVASPCNAIVPPDGIFDDYSNVKNCSCANCDLACPKP